MLIISVLAAGFVAAALFSSRVGGGLPNRLHRLAPAAADERGITLQTLIVTAVLVLMAVAAGVVIVAITNSSSDDLEESGNDLQERCKSVEIYDPVVASRNELGVNFSRWSGDSHKIVGSAIGCIPVCVWTNGAGNALDAGEVKFVRDATQPFGGTDNRNSGANPDDIYRFDGHPTHPVANRNYFLFSGDSGNIQRYVNESAGRPLPEDRIGGRVASVAVAPNKTECHTYDANGDVLLG